MMTALLLFAVALLVAVLISDLFSRSILSGAAMFLVTGFAAGPGAFGLLSVTTQQPVVEHLTVSTLVSVLFTDGMRLGIGDLAAAWRLPGRALAMGLPLTLLITAVFAHYVAHLPWVQALLVAAVLSPTDPVLASAIVGRRDIPWSLRQLLNIESGFNDGLALPIVLILLAVMGADEPGPTTLLIEVVAGVAIGVVVPWLAVSIARTRFFVMTAAARPLFVVAVGLLVVSLAALSGANEFLAAFSAGITLASLQPKTFDGFAALGQPVTQLLKLASLLAFGALITPSFLIAIPPAGYMFALLALLAARPAVMAVVLLGSDLSWRERATAGWFGPKGFSSIVYGIWIVQTDVAGAEPMFHLIALVITGSVIAHSSTDVVFARWLLAREP